MDNAISENNATQQVFTTFDGSLIYLEIDSDIFFHFIINKIKLGYNMYLHTTTHRFFILRVVFKYTYHANTNR